MDSPPAEPSQRSPNAAHDEGLKLSPFATSACTRWRAPASSSAQRRSRSPWRGRFTPSPIAPIDLGYTGLALFLPGLLFLLPAGHIADRFDRRRIILTCYALQVLCTLALLMFARTRRAQRLSPSTPCSSSSAWAAPFQGRPAPRSFPTLCRRALCQRRHLGRRHLAILQHHRPGARRPALHPAARAFLPRHGLGGSGHCLPLHPRHPGLVSRPCRQPACAPRPHGAPRRLIAGGPGRLQIRVEPAACCWVLSRSTCLLSCWAARSR